MAKLIVALDFDNLDTAADLAEKLREHAGLFKIGMEAWADPGVGALFDRLRAQSSDVFLDLKIHDIPETVSRTVKKIIASYHPAMLSVLGYPKTLKAAIEAAKGSDTRIIAVNMLSSDTAEDMFDAGYTVTKEGIMGRRTDYAVILGAGGMVCAAEDVKRIRSFSRGSIELITAGIRLPPADKQAGYTEDERQDQKRASTPYEAVQAGAAYYVVGRPIIRSKDPVGAALAFVDNANGKDQPD